MTPLERFHDRAAAHLAALPEAAAEAWIDRHGLLALGRHPGLPPALAAALDRRRRANLAANLLRVRRFQEAADALGEIPVCPLKGIHLLGTVYAADPESRVLADLDLLVREADAETAAGHLADRLGLTETAASAATARVAPQRCLAGGGLVIDLHTRLGIKHGWATTWQDLAPRPGRLHERDVHLLDPETTLVHLVTHFVRHGPFVRLAWVEDVLRQAEAGPDPARAEEVARRLGARRSLAAGVRLLGRLAGEGWLPGVTAEGDLPLRLHEALVWARARRYPLNATSSSLGRNLSACLLADGPRDLLRFLAAKGAELRRRPWSGFP